MKVTHESAVSRLPACWTRMPARMEDGLDGWAGGRARRPLNKNAANRPASFLVLGPFSSCAMADQQKQTELHSSAPPGASDQTPINGCERAWRVHRGPAALFSPRSRSSNAGALALPEPATKNTSTKGGTGPVPQGHVGLEGISGYDLPLFEAQCATDCPTASVGCFPELLCAGGCDGIGWVPANVGQKRRAERCG